MPVGEEKKKKDTSSCTVTTGHIFAWGKRKESGLPECQNSTPVFDGQRRSRISSQLSQNSWQGRVKTQNTSELQLLVHLSESLQQSSEFSQLLKLREMGELEKGTTSTWQMQEQHQKARCSKGAHQQSSWWPARKRRGIFQLLHQPPAKFHAVGNSVHTSAANRRGLTPAKGCKWYSLVDQFLTIWNYGRGWISN